MRQVLSFKFSVESQLKPILDRYDKIGAKTIKDSHVSVSLQTSPHLSVPPGVELFAAAIGFYFAVVEAPVGCNSHCSGCGVVTGK
jgi:hypothetical protein